MEKILIVDDDQRILVLFRCLLKAEGYEPVLAENGEEGVAAIKKGDLDLVITDLRMPYLDGLSVLRQSKALQPDLPVILLTAYGSEETTVEAVEAGVFDYLSKPFKVADLLATIKRALMAKNRQQACALDAYCGGNDVIKTFLDSRKKQS